ncbi:DUF4279 domain-containing protein [Microcella humidisoli]|uniref:DUF4279 domain-containing protein n=1 Tax=Microcella humidisoli TaxID=2963406 RepID=A0ABY5FUJ7_9MICO|nr:DUF4279 domain-containing protein [Microcella humidisoli]UTT61841.1 DUF4279 domain-containing protein [Microcella humidisoli]
MIVESSASLVITSSTMTVEQITEKLGIEPAASRNTGDPHGARRPEASGVVVQRTARETFWRLDSGEGRDTDSSSSLVALVDLLRDKRDNLASLRPMCTTTIIWGGFSDSDQGGFVFPAALLDELGALGCDLHGTAYLSEGESAGEL